MNHTGTMAHFTLLGGDARALIAHTTDVAGAARATHNLSPTATAALGRTLTATAMLAATLKGERDSLTLSLRGGGPLGSVVCVGRPDGTVKGYVDHPSADPPRLRAGKLDVGAAVGRDGFLTVVRDLGFGEPYIGRTPLVTGEIAEDIAYYLLNSEQTPTMLVLGVLVHERGVLGAGGALIQPLPGCPDEQIGVLEQLAPALSNISRLAGECADVDALADACLGALPREKLSESPIVYRCDCSRARMERVLLSLGEQELLDMIREQRGTQITCHFCQSAHDFSQAQLEALLSSAKRD